MLPGWPKEFEDYDPAWLCEKYVDEIISKQERSTRATFLRMIRRHEEKVTNESRARSWSGCDSKRRHDQQTIKFNSV